MARWTIENGFGVYDTNGDKIGNVTDVWDDNFRMDTGFLGLGKDYFVPYSAITDVRDDKVFVQTTKDRLDSMGWRKDVGVLEGGVAPGPERPLGGFQSGFGGSSVLAGDEKTVPPGSKGGSTMSGDPYYSGDWSSTSERYRTRWHARYGTSSGERWEDSEPYYRYGWEMHQRPEYRGRGWREVEPDLRRDWQTRHGDKPWDRVANSLRDAWEDMTGDDDRDTSRPAGSYDGDRGAIREDEAIGGTRLGPETGRREDFGTPRGVTEEERRRRERGGF